MADTPTAPTTGTVTPMVELTNEQLEASLKVSLADLSAKAMAQYAQKNYDAASELFARAAEMQAEMNGEMAPENAEILFLYGRCLFKVGQSKSDVLGGKAPDAKKKKAPKKAKKESNGAVAEVETTDGANTEAPPAEKIIEKAIASVATEAAASVKPEVEQTGLFQFQGDENFEESDEEEEDDDEEEGAEEEDDDLGTAFEILDMARIMFKKRLEAAQAEPADAETKDKGKEVSEGDSPNLKHIKERLGDTHDLLAEISLEDEKYPNAIADAREALKYKQGLYPKESELIAEAHFKLSLALEFASITQAAPEEGADGAAAASTEKQTMDEGLRTEAAEQLQAAIDSVKLKLQNKEVELATVHNPEDNEATRQQIADQKEILTDMEQRLVDLKKGPLDVSAALGAATGGLFGAPNRPGIDVEEAKKNATDLSGLVRKKRKAEEPTETAADKKAKVDEAPQADAVIAEAAKVEEPTEAQA